MAFTSGDWDTLIRRLKSAQCIPFLGAGAAAPLLGGSGDLSREWVNAYELPLSDTASLNHVAQLVVSAKDDPMAPKERIAEKISSSPGYDPSRPVEPYWTLSQLPCAVYMTTNYDDFLEQALAANGRQPKAVTFPWKESLKPTIQDDHERYSENKMPTIDYPVVYHLHGHYQDPKSIVITEDDYTNFLINFSSFAADFLTDEVRAMMVEKSLLFLGYSLRDSTFRVLFYAIIAPSNRTEARRSVTIQLKDFSNLPSKLRNKKAKQNEYLNLVQSYYYAMALKVFWDSNENFMRELNQRMNLAGLPQDG